MTAAVSGCMLRFGSWECLENKLLSLRVESVTDMAEFGNEMLFGLGSEYG